jgi:purine-binding chemotaxis protein CheW
MISHSGQNGPEELVCLEIQAGSEGRFPWEMIVKSSGELPMHFLTKPCSTRSTPKNFIMSKDLIDAPVAANRTLAGKYLTFTLQNESYGIDVLKVREIIRLTTITTVPQMPSYVRGVINLRGKIIPVIDLRVRFGFDDVKNTDQTCIIVVQVKLPDGKNTHMGLIVDGVEEVINLATADIEDTPDFGGKISTHYILGMAKVKGVVKTLLDIDGALGADTIQSIHAASA